MSGRLPLRIEFNRIFTKLIAEQSIGRGQNNVNARVVGRLTETFVDLFERERNAETHVPYFFSAVLAANINILAGLIRYSIPQSQQRDTLNTVLQMMRDHMILRMDPVDASTQIFIPGFGFDERRVDQLDTDAAHQAKRRAERAARRGGDNNE